MGYYEEHGPIATVDVLGVRYKVYTGVMPEDDPMLNDCDGYFDKTIKRIVAVGKVPAANVGDWSHYEKQILRHELVHAFMHESGIDGNYTWDNGTEHPEGIVAWISIQFPKMMKAFQEVGAL